MQDIPEGRLRQHVPNCPLPQAWPGLDLRRAKSRPLQSLLEAREEKVGSGAGPGRWPGKQAVEMKAFI